MRERWVAARREEGRRRLRALIAVMVALVVALGAFGLTRSPVLAVRQVDLTGGVHTTRDAVLATTGLGRGPQMLDLDLGNLRRRLGALPWVASAHVTRRWPATVVIRLIEREPLAIVADGHGQPMLVDGSGRVLDPASPVPGDAPDRTSPAPSTVASASAPGTPPVIQGILPVIQGLPPAGGPGTSLAGPARDALAVAQGLPPALPPGGPARLQAVVVAPDGTLEATLTPNLTIVLGTADSLSAKLLAVRTLLERVDPSTIASMDVRVPDSPILTHAGQAGTVSTTPRG